MFDLSALLLRLGNLRTLQESQLTFLLLLSISLDCMWLMQVCFAIEEKKEKNSEKEVCVCARVCRKEAG